MYPRQRQVRPLTRESGIDWRLVGIWVSKQCACDRRREIPRNCLRTDPSHGMRPVKLLDSSIHCIIHMCTHPLARTPGFKRVFHSWSLYTAICAHI